MTTCPKETVDSNATGLRFAWERCLKQLWPNPQWIPLEPNSYADFGSTVTTTARSPINPRRSRKKGSVTDLDAAGGFNQDLTQTNLLELSQAFFFANARQRGTTRPLNAPDSAVSAVTAADDTYTFANVGVATAVPAAGGAGYRAGDILSVSGGTGVAGAIVRVKTVNASGAVTAVTVEERGQYSTAPASPAATTGGSGAGATLTLTTSNNTTFKAGEIVLATGFTLAANNGLKNVVSNTAGALVVAEALTDETPTAAATLQTVGYAFETGDVDITMNGNLVRLADAGTAPDLTTLGLIEGEWIFLGGDAAGTRFTNSVGLARVSAITADYLEFDKVDWEAPAAEDGAAVALQIFFGTIVRNEPDPALIVYKPVQLERTLGEDLDGTMSQYLTGATANELTLNVPQAAFCTVDLSFVACDDEKRSGATGLKSGTRPALEESDAFNTASDVGRIKMSLVDETQANVTALFGHYTDCSLTINNNVSPNKAVGTLGAFATTAGEFAVAGEVTAYFTDMRGPQAVRDSADVTIDYFMVKNNAGMLWDIPLLALGGGGLQIEPNQPITVPLETNAAESKFGHTLLMQNFPYLPDIAAATV